MYRGAEMVVVWLHGGGITGLGRDEREEGNRVGVGVLRGFTVVLGCPAGGERRILGDHNGPFDVSAADTASLTWFDRRP
jgi:hypothetical protein